MNIVHLIVVKNSFYILESGRAIQKQLTLEPNLGDQNLVKFGTQQEGGCQARMGQCPIFLFF